MKKEFFTRTIATLLTLAVAFAFTLSNYDVHADTAPTATTSTDKKLLQYSNNWVIFKYLDNDGDPQFDVRFEGKTPEQWMVENNKIKYRIIDYAKYDHTILDYDSSWEAFSNSQLKSDISYYNSAIGIQFKILKLNEDGFYYQDSISEVFPLYNCANIPYITNVNIGYFEFYETANKPNKVNMQLTVNEPLSSNGNPSVKVEAFQDLAEEYLSTHPISNFKFENKSESYTIDGKTYSLEYSIVSFDVDFFPALPYDIDSDLAIRHNFTINGLVGKYTNAAIQKLIFYTVIPYREPENPTTQNPTTQNPTTQNPTTQNPTTQNPTTNPNKPKPKKISVKKIKLSTSKGKKKVKAGKTLKITATISPKNATNKKVTWSISKKYKKYASISKKGVFTAKKAGIGKTVTVTAKAKDGSGKKATIKIKIIKK